MALTLVGGVNNYFDANLIDQDPWNVFAAAQAGNLAAVHMVMNKPTFTIRAKTTDNSAASQVLDLTDLLVPLTTSTLRTIKFKSTAMTDNDRWVQTWEQDVQGGTTPVLHGSPRLISAHGRINTAYVDYGYVRLAATYAADTATVVAAPYSSAGTTIGDTSTGVATITHPIARSGKRCVSVHASTDVTLNTEHRYPAVEAGVSSTTMELSLMAEGITTATGIVGSFADVGAIDALLYILPPPSIALVMTSNNLEVHCGHDASDNVYHDVEVWVGRNDFRALVAD